jgi:glycosidase
VGFCINRDNCRTPMQWNDTPNAGFNDGSAASWLPVNGDYRRVNVKREREDPGSLLNAYRTLLHLRKDHGALHSGDMRIIDSPNIPGKKHLLAYMRSDGRERITVLVNFGKKELQLTVPGCGTNLLYSTDPGNSAGDRMIILRPLSGMIVMD